MNGIFKSEEKYCKYSSKELNEAVKSFSLIENAELISETLNIDCRLILSTSFCIMRGVKNLYFLNKSNTNSKSQMSPFSKDIFSKTDKIFFQAYK